MILPVTVPACRVTAACLTVTVTASGRRSHDSSFTVTVTLFSFTVTLSDLRVSQNRPRLGAPGRPASAPRPLSAGGLARGRQGLASCWVAAGLRHGRQQFLKQEFSWKKRETFALLSMRSSLAAAGSQP